MSNQINTNINRLSLHDSHIEEILRRDGRMELQFNWAKLENHSEKEIHEGLILGRSYLTFEGMSDEKLKVDFTGAPGNHGKKLKGLRFDKKMFGEWLVSESEVESNGQYRLSGLIIEDGVYGWLDWTFSFNSFKLSWSNQITWKEWESGKTIKDENDTTTTGHTL